MTENLHSFASLNNITNLPPNTAISHAQIPFYLLTFDSDIWHTAHEHTVNVNLSKQFSAVLQIGHLTFPLMLLNSRSNTIARGTSHLHTSRRGVTLSGACSICSEHPQQCPARAGCPWPCCWCCWCPSARPRSECKGCTAPRTAGGSSWRTPSFCLWLPQNSRRQSRHLGMWLSYTPDYRSPRGRTGEYRPCQTKHA